jgi:DNA protecting protein DprA
MCSILQIKEVMNWSLVLSIFSCISPRFSIEDFFNWQKHLENLPLNPRELELILNDRKQFSEYFSKNRDWFFTIEKIFQIMLENGIEPLYPNHIEYPFKLLSIQKPPLFLSKLGSCDWNSQILKLAIVGSREPQVKSLEWLEQNLSPVLQQKKMMTISGAARGIDQKAHGLSLLNETPTVAFLPSGLLNIYPYLFKTWVGRIIDQGGAVVSEFLPHQEMHKGNFDRRNRLIAGMADLLLVVEARRSSGTMLTAKHAAFNGTTTCVIPGHPTEIHFTGNNDLLFDGAQLVRNHLDLSGLTEQEYTSNQKGQFYSQLLIPRSLDCPNSK